MVADLNGDGATDLVVAPHALDGLRVFDGRTSNLPWERKSVRFDFTSAVCDVDGRRELVIGADDCRLHAIPAGG